MLAWGYKLFGKKGSFLFLLYVLAYSMVLLQDWHASVIAVKHQYLKDGYKHMHIYDQPEDC